jgi:hypothetical protein
MKLAEIKKAVKDGNKVYWTSENYEIRTCFLHNMEENFYIYCVSNGSIIGLVHADGITMNGEESDFYIEDLFEKFEQLPNEVQEILIKSQGSDYRELEAINTQLKALGYEFDYYLDADPYNLKKVTV